MRIIRDIQPTYYLNEELLASSIPGEPKENIEEITAGMSGSFTKPETKNLPNGTRPF